MALGVVTVGRRKFATNLVWQVSPSGQVVAAAKEAASQAGADIEFFSIRAGNKTGRLPQFGLGSSKLGHTLAMPAIAATVANRLPGSWAGAFKVREGIYFISVRDDLIMPEGDILYMDEVEARQRLMQEINAGGLQRIYAPEPWSIPGSEGMSLVLLVQDKSEAPLRPVKVSKKTIFRALGAAVIIFALVVAGLQWQQAEEERKQKEREQLEAAQRAMQQAMGQLPTQLQGAEIIYPPPRRYWEEEPKPDKLVSSCMAALKEAQLRPNGWQLNTVSCNKGGLSLSWSAQQKFGQPIPETTINTEGNGASRGVELKGVEPRGSEEIVDPTVITERFITQNWLGTLYRAPDDPPPPKPPDIPAEKWNPPPAPWVKRGFRLNVPSLPSELKTYFGGLPGVIMTSLTYNGGSWTVEGVIYENRK